MPIIKIEPLDTLFFKDGKPFTMGEDTYAEGIFPPPPSVIYGALRTAYFSENPHEFLKVNKADDPTKELVINGIFLGFDANDVWLPLPLDIVKLKSEKKEKFNTLALKLNKTNIISSSSFENLLYIDKNELVENVNDGFLHQLFFVDYIEGRTNNLKAISLKSKKITEFKIGIARNKETKISDDGLLYRVGMLRLKDLKIFIDYDFGNNFSFKNGFLKLGAEGKSVAIETIESIKKFDFHIDIPKNNEQFKLYLSTPAIFKNGWLPEWIDEKTLTGKGLKLINAVIGKPVNIGGFDMEQKQPKFMRKAVPAGSVYYFKKENETLDISQIFNSQSICDDFNDTNYKKQGFGHYYFAKI